MIEMSASEVSGDDQGIPARVGMQNDSLTGTEPEDGRIPVSHQLYNRLKCPA